MNVRRCCFLSMDDLSGYVSDDELAIEPLSDLGWSVETISWRNRAVDWNDFDAVVIRTTWDYQREPDKFLQVCEKIESSRARLENSIEIIKWNLDKRYLRDLENRGVRIVPTVWDGDDSEQSFYEWQQKFGEEIIIKPTVSATAEHTYRLKKFDAEIAEVFENRPFLVQPFLPYIVAEGEFSLFFFGGEYSHTILKSPKARDFRVQEEHGGLITSVIPRSELLAAAKKAFGLIRPEPLYARVDLVRIDGDDFALMELELIEPALYFRMDSDSPGRFAAALDRLFS